jgi:hypothetical protein
VGTVDCAEIPGLSLWFNSADHLPPHFHVEKVDKWEIRVKFMRQPEEMIEVIWGDGPSKRERKAIVRIAEEHRVEILGEWEEKANPRDPGPVR